MSNLIDQVRAIPHGVQSIVEWLGSGGVVVSPAVSQARANICLRGLNGTPCPLNVQGTKLTEMVADAVKRHLEVKNKIGLRVNGEKSLGVCDACGCQLKLLVHEPQERVQSQMPEDEFDKVPGYCWKLWAPDKEQITGHHD